ncbi:MAG: DUF1232 domain-containing protein [Chloroflexi bacterium]|nr:DUF1232 domain-containing protein [Chloroflexota bacterium]
MARGKRANGDDDTKRGRGAGLRRLIAVGALLPFAGRAPLYARLLWSLVADPRIPAGRKALLGVALGYIALGRDIVPDRVPLLGQFADLVVVALATQLFLEGLDDAVLTEKLEEAGIARAAYEEDLARMRRLVPGPLRRTVLRLPGALEAAGAALDRTGIGPRVRGWIG